MEDRHTKILISYAKQINQIKLKHRTRLKPFLLGMINGLSFTMFVYVVFNVLQILIFK